MYAAAFSLCASTRTTPSVPSSIRVRRRTASTQKTWLTPLFATVLASHSAPVIGSAMLLVPLWLRQILVPLLVNTEAGALTAPIPESGRLLVGLGAHSWDTFV